MKTLFRLVMLMVTLGGWALAAASLYVVRTPERITVLPRDRVEFLAIHKVFVDTRQWELADVADHPAVVRRLLDRDKTTLLRHLAPEASEQELARLLEEAVQRGNARNEANLPGPVNAAEHSTSDWQIATEAYGARNEANFLADWLKLARSLDFD